MIFHYGKSNKNDPRAEEMDKLNSLPVTITDYFLLSYEYSTLPTSFFCLL